MTHYMRLETCEGAAVVEFVDATTDAVVYRTDSLKDAFTYAKQLAAGGCSVSCDMLMCWPV